MATIVTRVVKGSPLTFVEADANFTNLNTEVVAAQADIDGHQALAVGAHAASAIVFTPTGTVAATNVQDAIAEVAAEASATTVATDVIFDAKGDLVAGTGSNTSVRLPVGANTYLLTADSSQASGIKWAAPAAGLSTDTLWDAKGDLVVGTAADTAAKLTVGADGYVLKADSTQTSGLKWVEYGTTSAPTVQTLTSGSGTYTKPAGCTRLVVRMVGAGGGGGGSGSAGTAGTGGTGGSTTFGLHTCVGGTGGVGASNAAGGAGGTATLGAGAVGIAISGASGDGSFVHGVAGTASIMLGGAGANAPFFGGSSGRGYTTPGVANTGGGGGGGSSNGTNLAPGAGGGSGAFLEFTISSPAASYSYAVGAAGTAGTIGTSGAVGQIGGSGQIYITEYYGNFDSVLQLTEPASTKQRFTTGSGTYTTPAGVNRIRVRMAGGGGGGAGGGTGSWGAGGTGGTSTFGTSLLTCTGGGGGSTYGGGSTPGGGTISAPAVGVAIGGTGGGPGTFNIPSSYGMGGNGGNTPFFCGAGTGGTAGSVSTNPPVANTGAGGGGGSTTNVASSGGGNGGASSGFIEAWIWSPSATYAYAVGGAGTAGIAGTNGTVGIAGATGIIEVEEFYGPTNTVADVQPLSGWPGRNRLINGDMRIDQRNVGVATAANASGTTYAADRWQAYEDTDGGFTTASTTSTPPTGHSHYVRVTVTSADAALAAAQFSCIQQKIEGVNINDLDWGLSTAKTVTLSFWVRSSLTGTFSGAVKNNAANRSYPFTYAISVANTWERKTVIISGDTTGTWLTTTGIGITLSFSLGTGSTYTGTAGAWAASGYLGATGETPVIGTNGATWDITGVQLEPGSVRTEYERESFQVQLAKCQRYYEKAGSQYLWSGNTTSASIYYAQVTFKQTKRTTPTVTPLNAGVLNFPTTTAVAGGAIDTDGFFANNAANATASGSFYQFTWNASAEL